MATKKTEIAKETKTVKAKEPKVAAVKTTKKAVEETKTVKVVKTAPKAVAVKAPKEVKEVKELKDLKELSKTVSSAKTSEEKIRKANRDKFGRSYATGKRKNSVARVWVKAGKGNVTINDRDIDVYFARPVLKMIINQPFQITKRENEFDVVCTVKGGGLSGQAGAIKHGISKALNEYDPELRAVLKKAGFLTRDARIVERKKFGKAKARRSYQFSKR